MEQRADNDAPQRHREEQKHNLDRIYRSKKKLAADTRRRTQTTSRFTAETPRVQGNTKKENLDRIYRMNRIKKIIHRLHRFSQINPCESA